MKILHTFERKKAFVINILSVDISDFVSVEL